VQKEHKLFLYLPHTAVQNDKSNVLLTYVENFKRPMKVPKSLSLYKPIRARGSLQQLASAGKVSKTNQREPDWLKANTHLPLIG